MARRHPTPAPDEDELDELEESDEPPRGRPGTRRSERTPRPVSSAPKLVAVPVLPVKASRGASRAPTEADRRAPADSFAVPASDEDIFKRIRQGRETSTPADTGRENAASKKRSRSRSVAPNGE